MRPGISYTADGNPFMKNPGSFAFSRATPKSSDRQQGPLAEPPKQSAPQPAQQQFGSNQSAGDYSAYAPRNAGSSPMNRARSFGYSGPGSSPMERMPTVQPPQGATQGSVMIGGSPAAVQDGRSTQREIDRLKQSGTWDDPRNAKARERLEQQLSDRQSAPPGYFRTPDGRLEPNYISTFGGMQQPPAQQNPPELYYPELYSGWNSGPAAQPGRQPPAPQPGQFQRPPQYGLGLNMPPGSMMTSDFRDSGGDGIDDRFQAGPGQPPPAFTAQTNYAPPQSFVMPTPMTPQGMPDFRQRDAFIAGINNSLGQQMSFGTPTPQPPQLNFPTLWQQAGQMVNNGWQNPLAGLFM